MNLKDKRTRRITAACASAAVVTAGGVTIGATFASANAPITISPGTSTLNLLNVDATADNAHAQASYGLSLGDLGTTGNLYFEVESGPGAVLIENAGTTTPTKFVVGTNAFSAAVGTPQKLGTATLLSNKALYLNAATAGTYKVRFFVDKSTPDNGSYDADTDAASGDLTLNVRDVTGTAPTSDDWTPSVTASSSVDMGRPVDVFVNPSGVQLSDVRGSASSAGSLANSIAALLLANSTNGTPDFTNAPLAYNGSSFAAATGVQTAATGAGLPVKTTVTLDGTALGTNVPTVVVDNKVNSLDLVATKTTNVKFTPAPGAAALVRKGTSSVTYTATATDSAAKPVAGAKVYFTLAPVVGGTIALTDLKANGSPLASTGEVGVSTDAKGVATLTVDSAKTDDGNKYTVDATSNTKNGATVTTTYKAAAATTVTAGGNVGEKVGGTVNLTGKLTDQWAQPISPAGVQATVTVGAWSRTVDINNGLFSSPYSDTAGNTTPRTDPYTWSVGALSDGGSIEWLAATQVGAASLDTLGGTAFTPAPATPWALARTTAGKTPTTEAVSLTGTLKDANGNLLPYKAFTLTASDGTYLQDGLGNWVSSLTASTSAGGALQAAANQSGTDIKVLLTKSGNATLTLTADSQKTVQTFKVAYPSGTGYKISVDNVAVLSGKNAFVTGRVSDAFGNPVSNVQVDVSLDYHNFGGFTTTSTPMTDNNGDFTVVFSSNDGDTGIEDFTAAIDPFWLAANDLDAAWSLTGFPVNPTRVDTAHGKITVTAPKADTVTLAGPAGKVFAGEVVLSGVAKPGSKVEIYSRNGGLTRVGVASADATTGAFHAEVTVLQNTTFVAETATAVSNNVTVRVVSTVKVQSVTKGKKGRVSINVQGGPLNGGRFTLWQKVGSKYKAIVTVKVKGSTVGFVVTPTKSRKYYAVTYTSPGSYGSGSAHVSIKR